MILAIDTCVLLDVLLPDPKFGETSKEVLKKAQSQGRLIICDIVYAELSPFFREKSLLDIFLDETQIKLKPCRKEVLWEAGKTWKDYLTRGGKRRERILPDFIIGAFAKLNADALITRDKRFYQQFFWAKYLLLVDIFP